MSANHPSKRVGFQTWYERQLFLSFGWLTSCILCGVLIAVLLEFIGLGGPGITPLVNALCIYVIGLGAIETWRRFWAMLPHAQSCANRATCTECGGYGLFDIAPDADQMPARCRRCGNVWRID